MKHYISFSLSLILLSCQGTSPQEMAQDTVSMAFTKAEGDLRQKIDSPIVENGWEMFDPNAPEPERLLPIYTPNERAQPLAWEALEPGLDYTEADAPLKCQIGDSKIRILRINLNHFSFKLILAGEKKAQVGHGDYVQMPDYCMRESLIAGINTSMFKTDREGGMSTGYMKNYAYLNNGQLGKDKSVIAFNPKEKGTPPFKIIDLECESWSDWGNRYHCYVQNIRMADCQGQKRWSKQPKYWSIACMGIDEQGRALLIHARTPYAVSDFIDMLRRLPLDMKGCCYLEGGPESSLYIKAGGREVRSFGSYETGFNEDDTNANYWPIPNIIGVVRRQK